MYVTNVFLSVFKNFKNLSINFKNFTTFKIKIIAYILSYKMAKNSSILRKFVKKYINFKLSKKDAYYYKLNNKFIKIKNRMIKC